MNYSGVKWFDKNTSKLEAIFAIEEPLDTVVRDYFRHRVAKTGVSRFETHI